MSSLSILVRSVFFSTLTAVIAAVVVVALAAFPARGDVVFIGSGTSSAGRPVEFKAKLLISGSNLTVTLENTSPTNSVEGADVLLDRLHVEDLAGTGDEFGELRNLGGVIPLDPDLDDPIRFIDGSQCRRGRGGLGTRRHGAGERGRGSLRDKPWRDSGR